MSVASPEAFGVPSDCTNLEQVRKLIASSPDSPELQRRAATYGMCLSASDAVRLGASFEDVRYVLEELSRAKTEIDSASRYHIEVIHITAAVLDATQRFVSETTIPCTEWPTPGEVAEVALKAARSHLLAQPGAPTNVSPSAIGRRSL